MRRKVNISKRVLRELIGWLSANLLLPLVAPFVMAYSCMFFAGIVSQVTTFDLKDLLEILVDKGVYAFLGIVLLLSLYQNYSIANKVINGVLLIPYFWCLFGLGFLFIDSSGLINIDSTFSNVEKRTYFYILSLSSVVLASALKFIIINRKIKTIYKDL